MNFDRLLRILVPRRIISAVRLLNIFQQQHGHVRQQNGFPVNGQGDFQPWLTYPMIEFLNGLDFSKKRIFEFGAGSSTLYWAKRAMEVVSVEFDSGWFEALRSKVPGNVTLMHESDGHPYADKIRSNFGFFDVIVVDGAERYRSAKAALTALAPGGMIILDNAEWYPNTADMLAQAGLIEMRFSGFSPINAFTSTTSAFLSRDFSIPQTPQARMPAVGGRKLPTPALDDLATAEICP